MQGVGMVRYPAFRGDPVRVDKVRLIDNQRVAFPMSHGVSAIGRRDIVTMRPSVGGDNLEAVVGLRQHHYELRSLDDLSDSAHVKEAHIQGAERGWNAA